MPPAVEVQILNHWTAREVLKPLKIPLFCFKKSGRCFFFVLSDYNSNLKLLQKIEKQFQESIISP